MCPLGIGLAAGPVQAGIMGSPEVRLEYTVIGDTVNLAARLCERAKQENGNRILLDETLAADPVATAGLAVESLGEATIKGKIRQVKVFTLVS